MSELSKLRMELKTELELISTGQGDHARSIDRISSTLELQGQKIAAQGDRILEHGEQIFAMGQQIFQQAQVINQQSKVINEHSQLIGENLKETARLGREVADGSRWMQGRMRHLQQRFDAVLGAVESDQVQLFTEVRAQQHDLDERVTRLEQERSSAA